MKKIIILFIFLFLLLGYWMINKATEKSLSVGMREIVSSDKDKGTFFISSTGTGKKCTEAEPCGIESLDLFNGFLYKKIKAGDVIFFRGGIYNYSMDSIKRIYLKGGSSTHPTIYESYPNELAIFDGSKINLSDKKSDWKEGRFQLRENYTILRKIEIRNMPQYGISIFGNYNIVEGCKIHDNHLSGVTILNLIDGYSVKDTGGSYNIVRDNIIYNNSDVGLIHGNYNNGDNADGISISSGVKNIISHNSIYKNSDDGIDTWKSMYSLVEYNLVYKNGQGGKGNGNGIKLGGSKASSDLGSYAIASHNLVYSNRYIGININSGKNVLMEYNTVYNNQSYGYTLGNDTILRNNISFQNKKGHISWSKGKLQKDNSWQLPKEITINDFKSLEPSSLNFLKPVSPHLSKMGIYVQ